MERWRKENEVRVSRCKACCFYCLCFPSIGHVKWAFTEYFHKMQFSIWLNALVNEMSLENICANRNHHHWTLTNKLEYTVFDMVRCYLRFSSVATILLYWCQNLQPPRSLASSSSSLLSYRQYDVGAYYVLNSKIKPHMNMGTRALFLSNELLKL